MKTWRRDTCIWLVLICMLLTACGVGQQLAEPEVSTTTPPVAEEETTSEVPEEETVLPVPEDSDVLNVYHLATDACAAYLVKAYGMFGSDLELNVTTFRNAADMDAQITEDLEAGTGPDVVLFHSGSTTLDVEALARDGAFLDLGPMMEADPDFDYANYYPILDAGIISGQQALMPLRFGLSYFLTSEEKLEAAGISLAEEYEAAELLQAMTEHAAACPEGISAMYPNDMNTRSQGGYVYDVLRLSGVDVLDMEDEVFAAYAAFALTQWEQFGKAAGISKAFGNDFVGALKQYTTLAMGGSEPTEKQQWARGGSLPWIFHQYGAVFELALEETARVLTIPNYDDPEGLTADIYTYAAVLESTGRPQAAYEFVRFAMDTPLASEKHELSVSRQATAGLLDLLGETSGATPKLGDTTIQIPKMTAEMRTYCETVLDSITSGNISNNAVKAVFTETMTGYLDGKISLEDAYEQLEYQMLLYLHEQTEE